MSGLPITEREILHFAIVLMIMLAYGLYRFFKPELPSHHKRFAIAALVLTFFATGVYSYLRSIWRVPFSSSTDGDVSMNFQWWALYALLGYGGYRLVQRIPARFRVFIGGVISLFLLSALISFGKYVYKRYENSRHELRAPICYRGGIEFLMVWDGTTPEPEPIILHDYSLVSYFFPMKSYAHCVLKPEELGAGP